VFVFVVRYVARPLDQCDALLIVVTPREQTIRVFHGDATQKVSAANRACIAAQSLAAQVFS
jgi:hypothetical protein